MAVIETALYFDPATSGVQSATIGASGAFSNTVGTTGDSTVEFWFQTPLTAPSRWSDYTTYILDIGNTTTSTCARMTLKLKGDRKLTWSLASADNSTTADVLGVSVLEMGRWYHVTLVIEAGGKTCSFYVNGNLEGSVEKTTSWLTWATNAQIMVGAQIGNSNRLSCLFGGAFSELRLWNVVRTLEQIRSLLTTRATAGTSGLIGYYDLKTSATSVKTEGVKYAPVDMSDLRDPNVLLWRTGTASVAENALYFEPTRSTSATQISHLPGVVDPQGNVTVEVWLRTSTGIRGVVLEAHGTNTAQMVLAIGTDNKLAWTLKSADGLTTVNVVGKSLLAAERWYHVAIVIEGNGKKCSLYLNGNLEKSASNTAEFLKWQIDTSAVTYLYIDHIPSGYTRMDGSYLSELRLWNGARTQDQIKSLMRTRVKVGAEPAVVPLTGNSGSYYLDQLTYKFVDMTAVWSLGPLNAQLGSVTAERDGLQQQCNILTSSQWHENALYFDPTVATTQYATIGGFSNTVGASGDSTVEFWLRTPASPRSTSVYVVDFRGTSGARMHVMLGTDNRLTWTLVPGDRTAKTIVSTQVLEPERWYHVALAIYIREGYCSCTFYLNGNPQNQRLKDYRWPGWATDMKVTLGNQPDATDNNSALLGGYLSEFRLWNKEFDKSLIAVRVTADRNGLTRYPLTTDDPTKVVVTGAKYRDVNMSEIQSATAMLSRLGETISDKMILTSTNTTENALYFDPTVTQTQCASMSLSWLGSSGNSTVEFWFRTPGSTRTTSICVLDVHAGRDANGTMRVTLGSDNKLNWNLSGSSSFGTVSGVDVLEAQRWYHVALVIEGGGTTCTLYVNGNVQNRITKTSSWLTWATDTELWLGNKWDPNATDNKTALLDGYLSEVRIWKVARTQDQIKSLMPMRVPQTATTTECRIFSFDRHDEQLSVYGAEFRSVEMTEVRSASAMLARLGSLSSEKAALTSTTVNENALSFYGSSNTTQLATVSGFSSTVDTNGNSTVEFWFRTPTSSPSSIQYLCDVRSSSGTSSASMQVTLGPNQKLTWTLEAADKSKVEVASGYRLDVKSWYHVALVIEGGGTRCRLYLNGNEDGYAYKTAKWLTWANDAVITLGNQSGATNNNAALGDAYLSDLRLWNMARTQDQLRTLMTTRATSGTPGLTVYALSATDPRVIVSDNLSYSSVDMAELRSTTAMLARLGSNVSQRIRAENEWSRLYPLTCSTIYETALFFDMAVTSPQSAKIGSFSVDTNGNSTVEFWFRTPSSIPSSTKYLCDVRSSAGTSSASMQVTLGTDNKLTWTLTAADGTSSTLSGVLVLEGNRWYHVALVIESGTKCTLYLNGNDQSTATRSAKLTWASDAAITLGNQPGATTTNNAGLVDVYLSELRLWQKARTKSEIESLMTTRATVDEPMLKRYALTGNDPQVTVTGAKYAAIDMSELRSATKMLERVGKEVSDRLNARSEVLSLLGNPSTTKTLPDLIKEDVKNKIDGLNGTISSATTNALSLLGQSSTTKTLPNYLKEDIKTKIDDLNSTISSATTNALSLFGESTTTKTLPNYLKEDVKTKIDGLNSTISSATTNALSLLGQSSTTKTLPNFLKEDVKNKFDGLNSTISSATTNALSLLGQSSTTKTLPNYIKEDVKNKFEELRTNLDNVKNKLLTLLRLANSDKVPVVLLEDYQITIEGERDGFKQDNLVLNTNLGQKEQQIQGLNTNISELTGKLTTANETIGTLEGKVTTLAGKEQLIADLQSKISQIEAAQAQLSLEDFVTNANKEITRARDILTSHGSKYALGRVSLELKMVPGPGGVGMKFPSMDEMKMLNNTQLSTLALDFEAQDANENKVAAVVVPTVLGYTEVMARRKIVEAGLLVEISYQAVKEVPGRTIESDRVVNQIPKAGESAPVGSYVTIFIGRKS